MKIHRISVALLVGTMLVFGAGAHAEVGEQAQVTAISIYPGIFRERLMTWAWAADPSGDLTGRIAALTDTQIEQWVLVMEDPDEFVRSMEQATIRLQNPGIMTVRPAQDATTRTPTTLTTPFDPDYPPSSGAYKDIIIDAIGAFGIGGATNTDRCLASDWGDFIGVWWPLNKAIDTLDGACVVGGCDPSGVACGVACGILETAKVALKVAAVPLEACDVHQGAIDGAEIEGTYENTLGLVSDVAHVHEDLATHDTDIKALLTNIQSTVEENQRLIKISSSRQLEIMRLMITQHGRREINSDVLTCTGNDCPTLPVDVIICSDGGLDWPCLTNNKQ